MNKHIYESGLIGNCSYIAHVEKNTNISWLCLPRFDSDFIFGGMLDKQKGGEFTILPEETDFDSTQAYLENTNILRNYRKYPKWKLQSDGLRSRFKNFDRFQTLDAR